MVTPTVISTFAGGGGSSIGYKIAGYNELLAIEWDNNACETLEDNFNFPVWNRDITTVSAEEMMKELNITQGELDVLDGSPPCQGFSVCGERDVGDSRNELFKAYAVLIKGIQPKAFVMENVSGMTQGKMKGMWKIIMSTLQECGYRVKCKLMNAKYYGVAQSRERLIFVGVRDDIQYEFEYPKPSDKIVTVREAFEKVENKTFPPFDYTKGKRKGMSVIELFKQIKNWRTAEDILGEGKGFGIVRIGYNKPSKTVLKLITNSAGLIHPVENRHLTIEELKRLQSFPDDYKLHGTFANQWARIGNSVPPLMMRAIATSLKETVLEPYYKEKA